MLVVEEQSCFLKLKFTSSKKKKRFRISERITETQERNARDKHLKINLQRENKSQTKKFNKMSSTSSRSDISIDDIHSRSEPGAFEYSNIFEFYFNEMKLEWETVNVSRGLSLVGMVHLEWMGFFFVIIDKSQLHLGFSGFGVQFFFRLSSMNTTFALS